MKMDEVSAELRALVSQHGLKRLAELADAIDHRDTPKVTTPSEQLASIVRTYRHKNPDVSDEQIAIRLGTTVDTVKEIALAPKPFSKPVKVKAKIKSK